MIKQKDMFMRLVAFISKHRQALLGLGSKWGGSLFVSYLLASTLASAFVVQLSEMAMDGKMPRRGRTSGYQVKRAVNYHRVRKTVTARNLFNSSGELPVETIERKEESKSVVFDENAPCTKSSIQVELLGLIFEGRKSPKSFVTMKEKDYPDADIYQVGDTLFGQSQAAVHAIERKRVVLNNSGSKECIDLKEPSYAKVTQAGSPVISKPSVWDTEERAESSGAITLEHEYVEEALGEGFVKILDVGRMVPHNKDGNMIGYKLIGVKKGSLYTKVGLNSGDVITNVNGTALTPEKGFAFYDAFSEEKEIRLEYLKKGKTPTTVTVIIK